MMAEGEIGDDEETSDSSSHRDSVGSDNELGDPGISGDENSGDPSSR